MSARVYVYAQTAEQAALTRWKALEAVRAGSTTIGLSVLQTLTLCPFPRIAGLARADLVRFGAVEPVSFTTGPEAA